MVDAFISGLTDTGALVGTELLEVSELSSSVTITAATLSAQASDNSYNDSANGFVAAGFAIGNRVKVTGFTGNVANNIFAATITALTAGKMTIGGADGNVIVDDAAGESVTISKWVSRRSTIQAVANMAGGASGTAFPGSPAAGDKFYRTDRNIQYFYDGTRWLSTQFFIQPIPTTDALLPLSAQSQARTPNPWAGLYDIYVERVVLAHFSTTTTAANYFVSQFQYVDGGVTTNIGATLSTQNDTQSSWVSKSSAPNIVVPSSADALQVTPAETGTATAYLTFAIGYRLVG